MNTPSMIQVYSQQSRGMQNNLDFLLHHSIPYQSISISVRQLTDCFNGIQELWTEHRGVSEWYCSWMHHVNREGNILNVLSLHTCTPLMVHEKNKNGLRDFRKDFQELLSFIPNLSETPLWTLALAGRRNFSFWLLVIKVKKKKKKKKSIEN